MTTKDEALKLAQVAIRRLSNAGYNAGYCDGYDKSPSQQQKSCDAMDKCLADALAALDALDAALAKPDGWVLVPSNPTPEMLSAGCPVGETVDHYDMAIVYACMLSVSPKP